MNKTTIFLLALICYATPTYCGDLKRQKTSSQSSISKEEEPSQIGGTEPMENDEQAIHDEFLDGQIVKHKSASVALAELVHNDRKVTIQQIEYLLAKQADINCRGYAQRTLLALAAWQSKVPVFTYLMKKLPNLELADQDNKTAAFFAVSGFCFTTHMPLLFDAGACTPAQDINNCDFEVQKHQRLFVKRLLQKLYTLLGSLTQDLAIGKTKNTGEPLIYLIIEYMHPNAAKLLALK